MKTKTHRYPTLTTAFFLAVSAIPSHATLLFPDNFNVPDSVLDSASAAGRSGTLASALTMQSAFAFQNVAGNQVSTVSGPGRIRFHETTEGAPVFNFAAGATGTAILAAGGMRFEFDCTPTNITDINWLVFSAGFVTFPEPSFRVNHAGTDYGFGFRNNGDTFRFNNGTQTFGTNSFTPLMASQHITIDLAFTSFADGSNVTVTSRGGATQVDSQTFQWGANEGVGNFELESFSTGTLIDNLSISTISQTFASWIATFPNVGGQTAVGDDPDGDGIDNGAENFFGTNPGTFSQGLVPGTVSGSTFTCTHPLNPTPASDLTAAYQWSKDLSTFTPNGGTSGGSTVTFVQGAPAGGMVTVTATVTGTPLTKLFASVKVMQN